jgi:hypothetical protein
LGLDNEPHSASLSNLPMGCLIPISGYQVASGSTAPPTFGLFAKDAGKVRFPGE